MIELNRFIIFWLLIQLIFIIIVCSIITYKYRLIIKKEILKHKKIYFFLSTIFFIGLIIRLYYMVHGCLVINDQMMYLIEGLRIYHFKTYLFIRKLPMFPILISLFNVFSHSTFTPGSLVNAFFGSLSIIVIYLFVFLITKNRIISLIASFLLTFFPKHIFYSTISEPFITSIFFIILTLIIFILALNIKKNILFITTGLLLGLIAQFYTLEIIFIIILILYLVIFRNNLEFKKKQLFLILIFIIISSFPFLIIQQKVSSEKMLLVDFVEEENSNNILCYYSRIGCLQIRASYLFQPTSVLYRLNNLNGGLQSYIGYYFFGIGTKDQKDFNYVFQIESTQISNKIQWQYLFLGLIGIIGLFLKKLRKQSLFFFLGIIFTSIILGSNYLRINYYSIYVYTIFIIPLFAISYEKIFLFFSKKKSVQLIKIIVLIIFILSLIFTENTFTKLEEYHFHNNYSTNSYNGVTPLSFDESCKSTFNMFSEKENNLDQQLEAFNELKSYFQNSLANTD